MLAVVQQRNAEAVLGQIHPALRAHFKLCHLHIHTS
jgi:anti-anti-sigma regulatory factor